MNREHLRELFETFESNGYQLYVVGGAVRDALLGEKINDIDFTTDARPEEIEKMFDRTNSVGAKFGTIQVEMDQESYQITTFRSEAGYDDKRHPDQVRFSKDLYSDLSRRDFTVNALAVGRDGQIIDQFDGIGDLKNGIIRTIGSAEERFSEDQLRKWRCVRFATQKGFEIDEETYRTLVSDPDTSMISIERIRDELTKIILSEKVNWGGYLLIRSGLYPHLLKRVLPEHESTGFETLVHPFEVMHFLPKKLGLRLGALVLDFEYDEAEKLLKNLSYSNKIIKEALSYHRYYNVSADSGEIAYKRAGAVLGIDGLEKLYTLQITRAFTDQDRERQKQLQKTYELLERIKENGEPLTRGELAIKGDDLVDMGISGRAVGEVLDKLLDYVYLNPQKNSKNELKKYIHDELNFD